MQNFKSKLKNVPFRTLLRLSFNTILLSFTDRGVHLGLCPICEKKTIFFKSDKWLRDHYRCIRCLSLPRQRAIIHVLRSYFPKWRELKIHESSPNGATFKKFLSECQNYIPTQYFPNQRNGVCHDGFRSENLSKQTFRDESFDIVVTQDVLEHLLDPIRAFKEICRTLKPGGVHIFTVPWYYWQSTKIRAVRRNGNIEYLETPDYHSNPVSENGSLVVTEWGKDLIDTIYAATGMTTTVIHCDIKQFGIKAKFIEVFVSKKNVTDTKMLINRW